MKALHIIQSLERGGCENMLLRSLPLINDFDHEILTIKTRGELAGDFEGLGIRVSSLNGKWWQLIKIVNKIRPNIVVTYLFHADFFGRMLLGTLGGYTPIPYLRTTYNYPRYRLMRWFEKLTTFMVPAYLANSLAVKDYYEKNLNVKGEKIKVISNGIDMNLFEIPEKSIEQFREKMGIKNTETVIVCVANMHPNKGQEFLLKAFEKLYDKDKGVWLWLVGEGVNRDSLEREARSLSSSKRIKFLGKRNDVPIILKASNIFVLPTLFEGMSNSILEAMACGLPIITTNIKENQELLTDRVNGLLVATGDVEGIYKQLLKLIADKKMARRIGVAAAKEVRLKYDIRMTASTISNYLRPHARKD